MDIKELFKYRKDLLSNSCYPDGGGFADSLLLDNVLPDLLETKLIDSEDINNCFYNSTLDDLSLRIDAYCINETGERLQLFLINDTATSLSAKDEDLIVSKQSDYDEIFNKTNNFIKKTIKKHVEIQDSDPAYFIVEQLRSSEFINQIDVIEIFLISPTLTVTVKNDEVIGLKKINFKDKELTTSFLKDRVKEEKSILLKYALIDLNYLHNVSLSKGQEYALEVDVEEVFGRKLEVLKAAETNDFESYLCVLPAEGIAALYRNYSTRLLEKNVRSFLQFRGVNSGMRKTIRETPEKFIAYNNGLTITATKSIIENEGGKLLLKSLTDFQIVNGGQTTASIFFSKKDNYDISAINLMAKINIAKNLDDEDLNTLISNISLYSNSQSKVSKVDLRSRDPKIDRIKQLSETVLTPAGKKWFFEKSKGEFSTKKRLSGDKIERDYPKTVRLSKTDIAKYHTSWGDQPWLVKKGGEKVFRTFMENLNSEGPKNKEAVIDRDFYENLISKCILFREMELIHGTRTKAIGQLRSAVVPYSLSVLFYAFGGSEKREASFDLGVIWKNQCLKEDLKTYLLSLMVEMYSLIEKYKFSTDISENTKKKELWDAIKKSKEIKTFLSSSNTSMILQNYKTNKRPSKKRKEVNFSHINSIVDLISKTKSYYSSLEHNLIHHNANYDIQIPYSQKLFTLYIDELFSKKDISPKGIVFFEDLFNKIRVIKPELFDELSKEIDTSIINSLDKVMVIYGNALNEGDDIETIFKGHERLAISKGFKFTSSINEIGKSLNKGVAPSFSNLKLASDYLNT